jgi:RNA polymerase sigma-70 factor, ECF subfamily
MDTIMNTKNQSLPQEDDRLAFLARTDADAFAELYRRHVTRVYRYHMAHTGNVRDAEDLTSQTFTAALEGIHSFRASGSFAAWILGIAIRRKAMFFRSSRPEVQLEAALHVPAPQFATDKLAHQRIRLESIIRALGQISRDRAEAISLCFFGGLTNLETSRVLNKTEAAVKMLVSRGLQDLRERTSLRMEVEE